MQSGAIQEMNITLLMTKRRWTLYGCKKTDKKSAEKSTVEETTNCIIKILQDIARIVAYANNRKATWSN
jgi:hypothetical protein